MTDHLPKILNVQQIREVDTDCIKNEPITSINLMERASLAFVSAIEENLSKNQQIVVVCGIGNNGGDGLAVARILKQKGYSITPVLIQFKETLSQDCLANLNRLEDVLTVKNNHQIPNFDKFNIIIDALFGSGLTRPPKGLASEVIKRMNKSQAVIFSIDIPSGMYCDEISDSHSIVQSDLTISFQRPKFSFFFPEYTDYLKEWKVVSIGLNESFIQQQSSQLFVLDHSITKFVKPRKRYSHKGTYGHALMIAGSYGKIGASVLASKACLRSGTGLLTSYVPKCGYQILQAYIPEAMCITDTNTDYISEIPTTMSYSAIGAGPGIGKNRATVKAIRQLLTHAKQSLVLDADAINILAEHQDLLQLLPNHTILTPHIKEFERLTGICEHSKKRFEKQLEFSKKHQCFIVLKDAHTSISDPNGNLFFNTSGNPGMATGGSGDVLTGIITGLLAQQYTPLEASLIGVYFHGLAGDSVVKQRGQNALLASDIIENLKIHYNNNL